MEYRFSYQLEKLTDWKEVSFKKMIALSDGYWNWGMIISSNPQDLFDEGVRVGQKASGHDIFYVGRKNWYFYFFAEEGETEEQLVERIEKELLVLKEQAEPKARVLEL